MAEIKIKKKQPIWPLILVVLVILALVYFLFFRNNDTVDDTVDDVKEMVTDDERTSDNNEAVMLSDKATSKISEYNTYIANDAKMDVDHEYSNGALTRLIDATEAVAKSLGVDIKADLETARTNATSITKNSNETDHANKIKKAGNSIAQGLKKIQKQKYPNLDSNIGELEKSIEAITPNKKVLDQKSPIKNFYKKAGKLLTNMKNI